MERVAASELAGEKVLIVLDSGREPLANLHREEELFQEVEKRNSPDIARFWVDSECLVRGRARSAKYGWYHEDLAKKMGIKIIERTTGGGVVYHDKGNLNWSFFWRNSGRILSPMEMFERASEYVVKALTRLGVEAHFAPPNRIDVQGRKVSGLAARSTPQTILVHGTLLLHADLEKLNMLCIPPLGCPPVANLEEWVPDIHPLQVVRAVAEVLKDSGFDVKSASGKSV